MTQSKVIETDILCQLRRWSLTSVQELLQYIAVPLIIAKGNSKFIGHFSHFLIYFLMQIQLFYNFVSCWSCWWTADYICCFTLCEENRNVFIETSQQIQCLLRLLLLPYYCHVLLYTMWVLFNFSNTSNIITNYQQCWQQCL